MRRWSRSASYQDWPVVDKFQQVSGLSKPFGMPTDLNVSLGLYDYRSWRRVDNDASDRLVRVLSKGFREAEDAGKLQCDLPLLFL